MGHDSLLLLLLLATCLGNAQESNATADSDVVIYHHILNYTEYCEKMKSIAGEHRTVEVTQFGTGGEMCEGNGLCRFYIYLYEADQAPIDYTILITAGLHGNEHIGPTAVLYAYPLLRPANTRIIYFPIGNPSGYSRNKREIYPQQVDPNRDYPIDGNRDCYLTSATRIIDHLFRTYPIDLTVNLHNGGDEIGWNWGTHAYRFKSHTPEYDLQWQIGKMMDYYGGSNPKIAMKKLKLGTMSESVYPAEGTLDDWAYAGSWDSTVLQCRDYRYEPYPQGMHNGLVFLLELGMHKAPEGKLGTSEGLADSPISTSLSNGYVTRALRMLTNLVVVLQPEVSAVVDSSRILIKVHGCKEVTTANISIASAKTASHFYTDLKFSGIGGSEFSFVSVGQVQFDGAVQNNVSLEYSIECDRSWQGKGKTVFGQPRIFKGSIEFSSSSLQEDSLENFFKVAGGGGRGEWGLWLLVVPGLLFALLLKVICCKDGKKCRERRKKSVIRGQERFNDHELIEEEYHSERQASPEEKEASPSQEAPLSDTELTAP